MRGHRWLGSLGWRLLAAFIAVAVSAVAVMALVAAFSVDRRSATLANEQRAQLRQQISSALSVAYTAGRGSWRPGDLAALGALVSATHSQVVVMDRHGREVAHMGEHHDSTPSKTPGPPEEHGTTPGNSEPHHPGHSAKVHDVAVVAASSTTAAAARTTTTIPIMVNGRQVGTARVTLPTATPAPVAAARAALLRQVWIGAGLAVLVAVAVAVIVARRVSRPLLALTDATQAFAAGEPHPETRLRPAPGEFGDLGRAFADMAATVRRQDQLRRALVADVAHELRTPVTILRGQTEQLLDGIAEPTPDKIVSLHDEVLRLGRLTDDLATLSAADAAGIALQLAPVDLGQLAEQSIDAMRAHFDDAGLKVDVDADRDVVVRGDAARLRQVLTNLLTNAAKFTPPDGQVTVTVHAAGPDAVLAVTDSGPGIPTDELPHVFERFWRGRAAGRRAGTGIGLAVVEALVVAHRGTVAATSPATGGACFTVRLPLGR